MTDIKIRDRHGLEISMPLEDAEKVLTLINEIYDAEIDKMDAKELYRLENLYEAREAKAHEDRMKVRKKIKEKGFDCKPIYY